VEELQKRTLMKAYIEQLQGQEKKKSNYEKEAGPDCWNLYGGIIQAM